jgi:hypothetical protein
VPGLNRHAGYCLCPACNAGGALHAAVGQVCELPAQAKRVVGQLRVASTNYAGLFHATVWLVIEVGAQQAGCNQGSLFNLLATILRMTQPCALQTTCSNTQKCLLVKESSLTAERSVEVTPPSAGAMHCVQAQRARAPVRKAYRLVFSVKRISLGSSAWRMLFGCLDGWRERWRELCMS